MYNKKVINFPFIATEKTWTSEIADLCNCNKSEITLTKDIIYKIDPEYTPAEENTFKLHPSVLNNLDQFDSCDFDDSQDLFLDSELAELHSKLQKQLETSA